MGHVLAGLWIFQQSEGELSTLFDDSGVVIWIVSVQVLVTSVVTCIDSVSV